MTRAWASLLPGEDADLGFMPMSARRALDRAGRHLALAAWQVMPFERRAEVVALGAAELVDVDAVLASIADATPPAAPFEPLDDVSVDSPPASLACELTTWRALGPVARHALASYVRRGKSEKAVELLRALNG